MHSDPLRFPQSQNEQLRPSSFKKSVEDSAFAIVYSEALQEMEQASIAISSESDSVVDPLGCIGAGIPAPLADDFASPDMWSGEFSEVHSELLHQLKSFCSQPHVRNVERETNQITQSPRSEPSRVSQMNGSAGSPAPSKLHRLISWLDLHAHVRSTHRCAASVRQAMEAAGITTTDRPVSGDAGDYGPFLLRHGAQVIPQDSYNPQPGDIAVFNRTEDHPAGHIQVYDGQRWVSDFVQHSFSPYRDPHTTPSVTVYRLA